MLQPGYQNTMGTTHGTQASNHYNATVREATLRHAMTAALRNPSPVFTSVTKKHFKLKHDEILGQVDKWVGGPVAMLRSGTVRASSATSVSAALISH